ncbi:hypothetical protein [Streptomyces sp. NPDC096030]|uniref:hypothetical protein n=1 Tax=Streptomyces sp. NPDC096030 TaxID=3155423 RepID=UPI0033312A9C
MSAVIFGLCWPNDSVFSEAAMLNLLEGESLHDAGLRLKLGWNPSWLVEAGFSAFDSNGAEISEKTSIAGQIEWSPELRTCRLDDQVADSAKPTGQPYRRRTSGEIALLSLWASTVNSKGIKLERTALSSNSRGAQFRDCLIRYLQCSLPEGWSVRHEVPLTHIRGLHMRRDVSDRKSDILIIDEGSRLVAALSSKWTWRSDRGTEAAQMVPLTRYRPDVPYALATAEFPRAARVTRESIEDRTYHVCPDWVGSWIAVNDLPADASAQERWPDLDALRKAGRAAAERLSINGLDTLVNDLKASGDIL